MKMDDVDKKKLTSNRSFLVKNISNTMKVVDKLMEEEIINDAMKQKIQAKETTDEKNRELLNILGRRGPKAFEAFWRALVETDQAFVADKISSGAGEK